MEARKLLRQIHKAQNCIISRMLHECEVILEKYVKPIKEQYGSVFEGLTTISDFAKESYVRRQFLGEEKDKYHIQSNEAYDAVIDDRFYTYRRDLFDEIGDEYEAEEVLISKLKYKIFYFCC